MANSVHLYLASAQESEPEYVDPQIPAISPFQIRENDCTAPRLHLQAPRFGLMLSIHKPKFRIPQHFPAGSEPSHS